MIDFFFFFFFFVFNDMIDFFFIIFYTILFTMLEKHIIIILHYNLNISRIKMEWQKKINIHCNFS